MAEIEARLAAMGLVLPAPARTPPGMVFPFPFVRLRGTRAFVSGHVALDADGGIAQPLGKLGEALSVEEGYEAARLTGLAILSSLKRALGDLDRVTCWLKALGMVNSGADFRAYPAVVNGFSDLILALYGPERGAHARSAVGMAGLPFNAAVEIEAEVEIAGG